MGRLTSPLNHNSKDYNNDFNGKKNMSFIPLSLRRCPINFFPAFECLRRRLVVIMLLLFNIAQANYISRGKPLNLFLHNLNTLLWYRIINISKEKPKIYKYSYIEKCYNKVTSNKNFINFISSSEKSKL